MSVLEPILCAVYPGPVCVTLQGQVAHTLGPHLKALM